MSLIKIQSRIIKQLSNTLTRIEDEVTVQIANDNFSLHSPIKYGKIFEVQYAFKPFNSKY